MKRLLAFLTLLPVPAFAHGGHAPVDEAAHGAVHAAPAVLIAVIAVVVTYWALRGRS